MIKKNSVDTYTLNKENTNFVLLHDTSNGSIAIEGNWGTIEDFISDIYTNFKEYLENKHEANNKIEAKSKEEMILEAMSNKEPDIIIHNLPFYKFDDKFYLKTGNSTLTELNQDDLTKIITNPDTSLLDNVIININENEAQTLQEQVQEEIEEKKTIENKEKPNLPDKVIISPNGQRVVLNSEMQEILKHRRYKIKPQITKIPAMEQIFQTGLELAGQNQVKGRLFQ